MAKWQPVQDFHIKMSPFYAIRTLYIPESQPLTFTHIHSSRNELLTVFGISVCLQVNYFLEKFYLREIIILPGRYTSD